MPRISRPHPRRHRTRLGWVAVAGAVAASSLAVTAFAASRTDTTLVQGTVGAVVRVTAPGQVRQVVCPRRTSFPVDIPVTVATNAPGYVLQVVRAAFVPTNPSAEFMLDAPTGVGQVPDVTVGAWRTLGAGTTLRVGHRTGTQTTAAGDRWSTHLRFGAVSRSNGSLTGKVTYRATAGARVTERAVQVVLLVRPNCEDIR